MSTELQTAYGKARYAELLNTCDEASAAAIAASEERRLLALLAELEEMR